MSSIADHAVAYGHLAVALGDQAVEAEKAGQTVAAAVFEGQARAHMAAAKAILDTLRRERLDHSCTMDHAALPKGVAKCGACGAPRG